MIMHFLNLIKLKILMNSNTENAENETFATIAMHLAMHNKLHAQIEKC